MFVVPVVSVGVPAGVDKADTGVGRLRRGLGLRRPVGRRLGRLRRTFAPPSSAELVEVDEPAAAAAAHPRGPHEVDVEADPTAGCC